MTLMEISQVLGNVGEFVSLGFPDQIRRSQAQAVDSPAHCVAGSCCNERAGGFQAIAPKCR